MKQIGILVGLLILGACMIWAQDNSSSASSNAAQTTTAQDNSNSTQNNTANQDQSVQNSRKQAAAEDDNAAEQEKQNAKEAGSKQDSEHDKAMARIDDGAKDLNQLLAAPDNGIPADVFAKAKCVAVVPSMVKGGFIFGAEHGRGVASCRLPNGGWSAPAFFVMTGGSWGAQIGAEGVDLVMLIMNDNGMNQLLSAKFKIGGAASASAGPVGRQAAADTSWKMDSEILTYSRARGLFAGATLNGTVIKADENAMHAYYARMAGFRPVLTGQVKDPATKDLLVATLERSRAEINAQAH